MRTAASATAWRPRSRRSARPSLAPVSNREPDLDGDQDRAGRQEQPGPAHARRLSLVRSLIGCGLGGMLRRSGNDFTAQLCVGRQYAVEANQMETRARHQGREIGPTQFSPYLSQSLAKCGREVQVIG